MQRIQIRPLTGAVNLPLNIAALGLKEMEGALERGRKMEGAHIGGSDSNKERYEVGRRENV